MADVTTPGTAAGVAGATRELRRNAIGLREVLFQSITDMAPGAAIAASIPFGVTFAGGSLPLAVVVALVASLFTAWAISQLASEIPAAGSMATYAAKGLHPVAGFLVAWGYVMVGWLVAPLVLLQLGFTTAAILNAEFSSYPANLWWPWSILGMLIVFLVGYFGIRASAGLGTILGIFEIAVFLVFGVMLVVHAGGHNTLSVFGTGFTPAAHHGFGGIIAGSVFTVLAFLGFESAAPLAEEARNPRRTVQIAVVLSTLLIGALYVFTTYAMDVAFGPKRFVSFTTGTGAASWVGVARGLYGLFWILVFFAIINSTLANSNAGVNVASRTAFAMGRIRAFPSIFGSVTSRHRSPLVAIALGTIIGLAVMLGLGLGYDPVTAFGMIATSLVILLVGIYMIMNAACIGYFGRRRHGFSLVSHMLVPVIGIVAFVLPWCAGAGVTIPGISFLTPLPAPLSYMGPATAIWMVIGIIYLVFLYLTSPQRVVDVSLIHLED